MTQKGHRDRMRLILTTPALQAHSMLRYASRRQVALALTSYLT